MGFGTGLNALLTLMEADKYKRNIRYSTLEAYPISVAEADSLNYLDILNCPQYAEQFKVMHSVESDQKIELTRYCSFTKHITKIEDFKPYGKYNVVYYDAFAPTTTARTLG